MQQTVGGQIYFHAGNRKNEIETKSQAHSFRAKAQTSGSFPEFRVSAVLTGTKTGVLSRRHGAYSSTFVATVRETTGDPPVLTAPRNLVHCSNIETVCPDLLLRCSLTKKFFRWREEFFNIDQDFSFILDGVTFGFKIVDDVSIVQPADCKNSRSALQSQAKEMLNSLSQ